MSRPGREPIGRVLGAGALAFGVLGIAAPKRLARMLGSGEDAARSVGFRDVGNALVIFGSADARLGIAQRVLYDVGDALEYGPRKRGVLVGALAFAALGVYALLAD